MIINIEDFQWTREPESCVIKGDTIEVMTKPHTDLWQRTYYHFQNDNAPVCHMYEAKDEISFGIYACSPEESTFKAVFTNMQLTECAWKAHDGQQPD